MPLKKGKSHIGDNIDELKDAGYRNAKQRIAIALRQAGVAPKKKSLESSVGRTVSVRVLQSDGSVRLMHGLVLSVGEETALVRPASQYRAVEVPLEQIEERKPTRSMYYRDPVLR